MCLLDMTQYAPPYAFRVMTVTFGTVASANAYSSFAPCRMMPPYSCTVPGRNPGTSSNVTSGMLNASQNRTNRAALTGASMARDADDDGPRVVLMTLEETAIRHDRVDDVEHVVGLRRRRGNDAIELLVLAA